MEKSLQIYLLWNSPTNKRTFRAVVVARNVRVARQLAGWAGANFDEPGGFWGWVRSSNSVCRAVGIAAKGIEEGVLAVEIGNFSFYGHGVPPHFNSFSQQTTSPRSRRQYREKEEMQ